MDTRTVVNNLRALLYGDELENTMLDGCSTETYEEGGYLTYDDGFVIKINGHRFQVTVMQES